MKDVILNPPDILSNQIGNGDRLLEITLFQDRFKEIYQNGHPANIQHH